MSRSLAGWLACTLVAAGVGVGPVRSLQAALPPVAGNWKLVVFDEDGVEITVALLRLTTKNDKVDADLLSSPNALFKKATVAKVKADDKSVNITFQAGKKT